MTEQAEVRVGRAASTDASEVGRFEEAFDNRVLPDETSAS
jgi:hypothetical protein